ncbi:MAG: PAS domain S-box protein [Deltaproteobacteria bacterium]|nr:PAS domain S-box protein [Deltaproteobacteria bacterium]
MIQPRIGLTTIVVKKDKNEPLSFDFLENDAKYLYQIIITDTDGIVNLLENRDCDLVLIEANLIESHISLLQDLSTHYSDQPIIFFTSKKRETHYLHFMMENKCSYFLLDHDTPQSIQKTIWCALDHARIFELENFVKQLRGTEQSFKKVVEHSADGVIIFNEKDDIILMNQTAEQFLGQTHQEIRSKPFIFLSDQTQPFIHESFTKTGHKMHLHIHSVPIEWGGKNCLMYVMHDITDRIQFEQQKDDFMNTVSHELRNPISIVQEGIAQVTEGLHGPISEMQEKMLALSLDASKQLQKIVDDLLDLAKLESSNIRIKRHEFDFSQLVEKTAESFKAIAARKNLDIKVECTNNVLFYGDPDRIAQVLNNLVGNSLKFTEQGFIKLSLHEDNHHIQCWVEDSGRGMTEQDISRLFNKFEQFGSKQHADVKGTGLGLTISKNLVNLHGGEILVESIVNEKTIFKLVFPRLSIIELIVQEIQAEIKVCAQRNDTFSMIVWKEDASRTIVPKTTIENTLRGSCDKVFFHQDNVIIVLPSTPKVGAQALFSRFQDMNIGSTMANLQSKIFSYPDDEDLFKNFDKTSIIKIL